MFPLIIELIYWSLLSDDIRKLIFGLLKSYKKNNKSLNLSLKEENILDDELDQPFSLFNPKIIQKLITIITPNELQEIKSVINKIKNPNDTLKKSIISSEYKEIKSSVKKVNDNINDLNPNNKNKESKNDEEDNFNKKNEENNNDLTSDKDINKYYNWINLSSSWFKKAIYNVTDKNTKTGELTALFQSDNSKNKIWYGPYTYPAFPNEIFDLMLEQRGKNGSGAGTIFWKYWNHTWLPSQIRAYVKKRLNKSKGITSGQKNKLGKHYELEALKLLPNKNINVSKTIAYINRLERNFPKLKTYKDLIKTDIGSTYWRKSRKDLFKNISYQKYKKNPNKWK